MIWRRRRDPCQSEAEAALHQANAAQESVARKKERMEPVLDRIQQHVEDNAIFAAFKATLRGAR